MRFYAAGIRLWEELSRTLNYNVMFSQRGQIDLIQTWAKLRDVKRRQAALRLIGVPFEILTPAQARERLPLLAPEAPVRLPVLAASWHPTAGVARHDAVASSRLRLVMMMGTLTPIFGGIALYFLL